ncbi:MAG: hypothetical protein ACO3EE_11145 [Flavobacteriales bacterium]
MKNVFIFLFLSYASFAQNSLEKLCAKPHTLFTFKNGKEIKLCGSSSIDNYYSEFILALGDSNIFEADGTQSFKINFQGDSLILEEYKWLPVGENRTFVSALWETTIFKNGLHLTSTSKINGTLMRYSKNEVMLTANDFIAANDSTPNKDEIAARLFIASLSHKLNAEKYFYAIQIKFHSSLDGAFSEDYADLISMYNYWNDARSECETVEKMNRTIYNCRTSWGSGGYNGIGPSDIIRRTTIKNKEGSIIYEFFEKSIQGGCIRTSAYAFIKNYNEKGKLLFIMEEITNDDFQSKITKTTFDPTGKIIKTETIDSSQFEKEKRRDY